MTDPIFGWNIFCNNRLVIRNDVTEKTGWGGIGGKNYHYPEDNRFLGLAFLSSDEPLTLPWHTTKEDIQQDSRIYRKAQIEMRAITNRLIDVIHLAGKTTDPDTNETIGKSLFENIPTKLIDEIHEIHEIHEEVVPAIKNLGKYERIIQMPDYSNINYSKEKKLIREVKKKLGNLYMSNKKAGESTFDYYVKMEDVKVD